MPVFKIQTGAAMAGAADSAKSLLDITSQLETREAQLAQGQQRIDDGRARAQATAAQYKEQNRLSGQRNELAHKKFTQDQELAALDASTAIREEERAVRQALDGDPDAWAEYKALEPGSEAREDFLFNLDNKQVEKEAVRGQNVLRSQLAAMTKGDPGNPVLGTYEAMTKAGATPEEIQAAIGPGLKDFDKDQQVRAVHTKKLASLGMLFDGQGHLDDEPWDGYDHLNSTAEIGSVASMVRSAEEIGDLTQLDFIELQLAKVENMTATDPQNEEIPQILRWLGEQGSPTAQRKSLRAAHEERTNANSMRQEAEDAQAAQTTEMEAVQTENRSLRAQLAEMQGGAADANAQMAEWNGSVEDPWRVHAQVKEWVDNYPETGLGDDEFMQQLVNKQNELGIATRDFDEAEAWYNAIQDFGNDVPTEQPTKSKPKPREQQLREREAAWVKYTGPLDEAAFMRKFYGADSSAAPDPMGKE